MEKVWRYTIDLPPMGTPRPNHRFVEGGKTITYYPQKYVDYMDAVQKQLKADNAINDEFFCSHEHTFRSESRSSILCSSS
ncbi:Uncharacterised protein [Staphylococcus intermedius NCTC 11048]|uniref:Uncharacterized protein n=1 Tax=Staphylococcus intermedius NCTC 11048 TaxID=1141106 RepID=A0A380FZC6_STAIN|nr:Uncharacterised protein [Staphylococcus intermedius NCTC 11048]SUM44823.1 Uncharacterised protein [Staphylococcus intermedius NCTC 11048]